jgi:hypothetical protein
LASNLAAGTFTIQNGANLTTASTGFTNAGTVNVGANSTFTVGGSNDYVQTGGLTNLQSSSSVLAVAAGHQVSLSGGVLEGHGIVQGNLLNGGTVHPGESPGILTVTGNYAQASGGILDIQISGANPGTGFSKLIVGGSASLDGVLNLSLINGFTPTNGETFDILASSGLSGIFAKVNGLHEGNVTFQVIYGTPTAPNDVILNAFVGSPVPEPSSVVLFGLGLAGIGIYARARARAHKGSTA